MTTKILEPPSDSDSVIRTAAFRLLLARAKPIEVKDLAHATGIRAENLAVLLDGLDGAGRIRRDNAGRVVGSAGLNVTPDRHEIELDGRRFWTWCAYDIVGIFGALKASGRASSPSPNGKTIELRFERGRPVNNEAVLFRPDDDLMSCCENVYEQWCPNSNLFTDAEQASSWAKAHAMSGRVLSLDEASDLGTLEWAEVTDGVDRERSL